MGIAPRLTKKPGFDLVFYSDCVEFTMEQCLDVKEFMQSSRREEVARLKEKLWMLHHCHIVHVDIKPQNVVFS